MGKTIYLTSSELSALRSTASEWCEMMGDGDDIAPVEDRLNAGLGSALKKLYKGTAGEAVYKKYQDYLSGGRKEAL